MDQKLHILETYSRLNNIKSRLFELEKLITRFNIEQNN